MTRVLLLVHVLILCVVLGGANPVFAMQQATGGAPGGTGGQTSPVRGIAPQTIGGALFANLSRVSEDYRVGPGDLLEIQFVAHGELNQTLRITAAGDISLPMVGLIHVADLTSFEVEETIGRRVREKELLKDPEVLVFIREYQAKQIYVSGAVVNPGQMVMSQPLSVSEAILLAGGLLFNAADEGLIHRRRSGGQGDALQSGQVAGPPAQGSAEIIKVDLRPVKEGRFLQDAYALKTGDVLVIPEMRMNPFYVVGDVFNPRNYFYPPGSTVTASQAISWAQGPTPTAKLTDGMLVRYDASGKRQEIRVDYSAILQGRQKDFQIEPHDIIFIPGSKVKTITHGLLLLTDEMAMGQAFRVGRRLQAPERPAPAQIP